MQNINQITKTFAAIIQTKPNNSNNYFYVHTYWCKTKPKLMQRQNWRTEK